MPTPHAPPSGRAKIRALLPPAITLWAALALSTGCEASGVGDACIPSAEYDETTPQFAIEGVYIESRSYQCATRVCIANHFQGRVNCPYGQSEADLTKPDDDPARCRAPGSKAAVTQPVDAWDLDRPAERSVYCSCRCDGPDPNARYCDCPSGFSCTPLYENFGFGDAELAGSYCIKSGTEYSPSQRGGPTCRDVPDSKLCSGE